MFGNYKGKCGNTTTLDAITTSIPLLANIFIEMRIERLTHLTGTREIGNRSTVESGGKAIGDVGEEEGYREWSKDIDSISITKS